MSKGVLRRMLVAFGVMAVLAAPAFTQGRGGLAALSRLEPGLWQLRDLDNRQAQAKSICVPDPALLMQVQHRHAPCSRVVIASGPRDATVHYTCPAGGFGRTYLRVETARLAQIDTQGISNNAPFAYRFEARRTGACTGARGATGR